VDRLVKDMAVELTKGNVCAVSLYPGVVKTERTDVAMDNGDWDNYVGIPLYNAESPEFTGRVAMAVATDPDNMKKSGTYQVVTELAEEYGFTDVDGKNPPSIHSFKFLIPAYAFDEETREMVPDWLIPDIKLPFRIMSEGKPPHLRLDT
jgi:dehydrogenase/reductase SDR family protein 1